MSGFLETAVDRFTFKEATSVLIINGRVVSAGRMPGEAEITTLLIRALMEPDRG